MLHYDILQNLQTSLLLEGANIVLQNIEGICNKHLNDVIVNRPKQKQGGDLIYRIVGIEVLNKILMQTAVSINMLEVLMVQNYILYKSQCMFDQILNYRIYSNLKNQICSYSRARRKWKGASVGADPEQITLPGEGGGYQLLSVTLNFTLTFSLQYLCNFYTFSYDEREVNGIY